MASMPDFSRYSLEELEDAYLAVDREKYPDNFQAVCRELALRKDRCSADYTAARAALGGEGGIEEARPLLEKVIAAYPGTGEASKAARLLRREEEITSKSGREEASSSTVRMELAFHGSAGEYFRIWIVNLCLTLLSCGIFSAWAKVRKKRYLYSHLTLDDTPFQYLGQPVPILKGRIIATVVFLLYYSSTNFFTPVLPYVFAAGLIFAPWFLVQSIAFNSRYTAFRNMTFRFNGTYLEAFKVLSAWGLVPVLVIGTLFDWWGMPLLAAVLFGVFGFIFPWWLRSIKHFIVTRTSFGGTFGSFGATGGQFFKIYFLAGLIVAGFGILTAMLTFSAISINSKNFKYITLIFSGISYIGYIVSFAYIQAHITNTVWNQISLGPVSFDCTLSGREMAKIYLTNALAIISSVGLLIPWAVIRTMRYRIEQTRIWHEGDLAEFRGGGTENVSAVGAEVTDFFDFDLAI